MCDYRNGYEFIGMDFGSEPSQVIYTLVGPDGRPVDPPRKNPVGFDLSRPADPRQEEAPK